MSVSIMSFSTTIRQLLAMVVFSGLLSACGGGGGDSDSAEAPTSPSRIFVSAGANRSVPEQSNIALTASASGDIEGEVWRWSITPNATITHDDNTLADAVFVSPVAIEETIYTATVTVTDSTGNQASDTVTITVQPDNIEPVATIALAPEDNQPENVFSAGVSLSLDGSESDDEDAPDPLNPISHYQWEQTAGENVLTADVNTELPVLTFKTPVKNSIQQLTFMLTVTDAEGATNASTMSLSVLSGDKTLPRVSAGVSQFVFSGEPIILDGEASTSVPAAMPLTYQWTGNGTPGITIVDDDVKSTHSIAPSVTNTTTLAYAFEVTDANGNRVEDTIEVIVNPMPIPIINDTGVTVQSNADAYVNSQQNAYPGQDAQRGNDAVFVNGELEKAGSGDASFDFTKLDGTGEEKEEDATAWACVRDNITGLVWERKTDDAGLHDGSYLYSWYQVETNGGLAGSQNSVDTMCSVAQCNTEAFVRAVNAQGLCGFYDWRLPTHFELMSLVHFGQTNGPKLDAEFFPSVGDSSGDLWYWTRNPSADGVSNEVANNAWAIDFSTGLDSFLNKSSAARVRVVRAGR